MIELIDPIKSAEELLNNLMLTGVQSAESILKMEALAKEFHSAGLGTAALLIEKFEHPDQKENRARTYLQLCSYLSQLRESTNGKVARDKLL